MIPENNKKKFVFGAHYYVPGASPQKNWENDLKLMRETGISSVHAIASWNWINIAADEFDFSELNLFIETAKNAGMEVQIGLVLESAPEWIIEKFPDWLYVNHRGEPLYPYARSRYQFGGWPGVCFDNEDARKEAAKFVRKLGAFAKDNSIITSIEAWTGIVFPPAFHDPAQKEYFCFCDGTSAAFADWLKTKYNNDLEVLNKSWSRKFTDWKQVKLPRFFGTFPDNLDWYNFLFFRQNEMLKWRIKILREAGFTGIVSAHAGLTHALQPQLGCDDHACAAEVDVWGFTNDQIIEGKKSAYLLFMGADLAKSAARGKPYFLSQLRIGPFASKTLQKESGHSADFIRFNNWAACAGGVSGIYYRSWKPQKSGHEAEGYGLTSLTGELNDRTEVVKKITSLLEQRQDFLNHKSPKSDIAILILHDSSILNYISESGVGDSLYYLQAVKGTYKSFFDKNISVDFIRIDQLDDYKVIYMPWPLMLSEDDSQLLAAFVENGGTLVSEACPGKFNDSGYLNDVVPPGILQSVFGCVEHGISQIITDRKTAPVIAGKNKYYPCANHQSFLKPTTGRSIGNYLTGEVAVVDNDYGKGKARLIGTNPSICFLETEDNRAADLIYASLPYAGVQPEIETSASAVHCKWLNGENSDLLMMVNLTNVPAIVTFKKEWDKKKYSKALNWTTQEKTKIKKLKLEFTVPSHDMLILEFEK